MDGRKQNLVYWKVLFSDQCYLTFYIVIYILWADNTDFVSYADDNNIYDTGDCIIYFFRGKNVQIIFL